MTFPKDFEDIQPEFHHITANDLPKWKDGSTDFTLVAGEGYGKTSPVPLHSPLLWMR